MAAALHELKLVQLMQRVPAVPRSPDTTCVASVDSDLLVFRDSKNRLFTIFLLNPHAEREY